jgi:long-chain acyl-CoA synthetase
LWITLPEVKYFVLKSLGIHNMGLIKTLHNVDGFDEMKLLGIFAKNREEWTITNEACNISATTIVPFFDSLGPDALDFIIS